MKLYCRTECGRPVHTEPTIAKWGLCFPCYSRQQKPHKPWAGAEEDRLVDAGLGMRRVEVQ